MIYQPFLFEENIWIAKGVYIDDQGRYHPVEGETKINHADGLWINDSSMILQGDNAVEYKTRCEIVPMERGQELTSWISENQALGKLTGKFIIVDDSIISIFTSVNGDLRGTEYLRLIDADLYSNRGVLLRGDKKISSWALELRKK
ncbi:MAG TPA: hypothetical protein DCG53_09900 [Syntrophus sp. (in: bacteria)]|nr:hypothetical protein [Syntrophus sp. (in: bacteria)]